MIFRIIRTQAKLFSKHQFRPHSTASVSEIFNRGFIQDVFPNDARPKIEELMGAKAQHIYAGFDPTADSLHVGNLMVLMGLIHFQRAGHNPIAVLGGATGRIGDPSGRSTERNALEISELNHNLVCIRRQIFKIFENHQKYLWNANECGKLTPVKVVNNAEWYENLSFLEFIGNIGRCFRIGDMLQLKSVKSRLDSDAGLNFTEFSYQICQSYDWLQLFNRYKCKFQLGGSDQLGNISAGSKLIKRTAKRKDVFGLTIPILTTRDGKKFGKSEGNAMWLDPTKTSPFSLYQFFIRTPDDAVENLLKLLTFIPLDEIEEIMIEQRKALHLRKAPQRLAEHLTLLIHGKDGLEKAKQSTLALFEGDFTALSTLSATEMKSVFAGAQVHDVLLESGMTILDLAVKARCFKNEREATRLISQGGFYINQNRCQNIAEVISPTVHILGNNFTLLRTGSRNYYIVNWKK